MSNKKCDLCNELFDINECNQEYGIISQVSDSDEEGTHITRKHYCGYCFSRINLAISKMKLEDSQILKVIRA